jgi:hypothetical protein
MTPLDAVFCIMETASLSRSFELSDEFSAMAFLTVFIAVLTFVLWLLFLILFTSFCLALFSADLWLANLSLLYEN